MMLLFIFSHLPAIVLLAQIILLAFITMCFFRSDLVKKISYWKLILITFGFNVFYGLFVTWAQYYVWANSGVLTKSLLESPLSKEAPLPTLLKWTRPLFENHFGYFLYYEFGRTWLYIFILFLISGILYFIFKIWKSRRGNFVEQGPELLLVLMLIVGYPGILVLIPLGFIFAILSFGFSDVKNGQAVKIEPAFILAAFVAVLFSHIILSVIQ